MTVITNATARTQAAGGWFTGARRALATAAAQGAKAASAARHRYRRPALVVSSFGCIAAAAYQVNLGVGLLVTGLFLFVFEMLGGDDE